MAIAKQPGGLYYVNGRAVNAEGALLVDAPPMPENTAPAGAVTAVSPADIDALVAKKVAEELAKLTAPNTGAPADAQKPDDAKPEKGK